MAKKKRPKLRPRESKLHVTVVNGDLSFVSEPLLIGHYRSSRLTGTERVMDDRIGGAMATALQLGLYPSAPGSQQVFINTTSPKQDPISPPSPHAVIVVGLGEEGGLTGTDLAKSVRQAVIAWAQRIVEEQSTSQAAMEIASTLMGTGGLGVRVGQAAQAIAQGVLDANASLRPSAWPVVQHLRLIELYLDRANEAWRALKVHAGSVPNMTVADVVESGTGPLERHLDAGYRGAEYDIISAMAEELEDGTSQVSYTLSTKRARSEVRAKTTQLKLVRQLVERNSNDVSDDRQVRKTLFDLLVPIELEPFLTGKTELQLEVSQETAGVPWELLDNAADTSAATKPWAIRTKLLRKLRTARFRDHVLDAGADGGVLIVGEPLVNADLYGPLPSAREEAIKVSACLKAALADTAATVRDLISPPETENAGYDGDTILKTLFTGSWRILHIAGHGDDPQVVTSATGKSVLQPSRGVVLSNDTYLGPNEIGSLRVVPELVFLNCCHLGQRRSDELLGGAPRRGRYDRARFASSIADALITAGVHCVIAAGWAVDDQPARVFAETFYSELLKGKRFIDAVAMAREKTWQGGANGNTWAAYQCYGDPDWTFRKEGGDAQRPATPLEEEFAGVGSVSELRLALHTIGVQSVYQNASRETQSAKIRHLEGRFRKRWGPIGSVAESFGAAWSDVGDREAAIGWYERARTSADATASLKAIEQLANLRVRRAWAKMAQLGQRHARLVRKKGDGTAAALESKGKLDGQASESRNEIDMAVELLKKLLSVQPTAERESLMGSAHKRRAMVEAAVGQHQRANAAIAEMMQHYEKAEALSVVEDSDKYYPAVNCLGAEVAQNAGLPGWSGPTASRVELVRDILARRNLERPNFWSKVGDQELVMYQAIAARRLASELEDLLGAYERLGQRVTGVRFWGSVYDQASFVLDRYTKEVSDQSEIRAAHDLLDCLAALCS
ncbi:MAG: CHAT domain-containing protein [Gemmatimonadaceae bacterium]